MVSDRLLIDRLLLSAIESDDKNTVIDRVESLGQVDEDGSTVLYFIDSGYDSV